MESSINANVSQAPHNLFGQWQGVEPGLDLEESARRQGALVRRRGIHSAHDLLRLVLVYCLEDWSLRMLGIWAVLQGIGALSDVALLKRLRHCNQWLGELVYTCLRQRGCDLSERGQIRVSLRDATVINAPGSVGTEWRLHLKLDLGQQCVSGVELTDAHGGETLARLPIQAGEIQVGDRGYCSAEGIATVLQSGGHVVVRATWYNLPLWRADSTRWDLIAFLTSLQEAQEQWVYLHTSRGCFPVRYIACPLSAQAAEEARRRARRTATKKGHTVSAATLLAAGFILLVTDLSVAVWPMERILWLYRLRWQIELYFKTCKSLLHFDNLRSRDPHLVQTYLFGKLLILLLLEQSTQQVRRQQPDWFFDCDHPLSRWTLTTACLAPLRHLLIGVIPFARFWACLPALARYVRGSPRARFHQLAWGQALLEHLSCVFSEFCC